MDKIYNPALDESPEVRNRLRRERGEDQQLVQDETTVTSYAGSPLYVYGPWSWWYWPAVILLGLVFLGLVVLLGVNTHFTFKNRSRIDKLERVPLDRTLAGSIACSFEATKLNMPGSSLTPQTPPPSTTATGFVIIRLADRTVSYSLNIRDDTATRIGLHGETTGSASDAAEVVPLYVRPGAAPADPGASGTAPLSLTVVQAILARAETGFYILVSNDAYGAGVARGSLQNCLLTTK